MPTILYNGILYEQTAHIIKCKKCLETIESKYRHDFKMCKCDSVGIDGGISAGNTILGDWSDIENKSKYRAIIEKKKVWLSPDIIKDYFQKRSATYTPNTQ